MSVYVFTENTGLHIRIPHSLPNGGGYVDRVREYWDDPKYVIILPVLRQISYEPLEDALHDLVAGRAAADSHQPLHRDLRGERQLQRVKLDRARDHVLLVAAPVAPEYQETRALTAPCARGWGPIPEARRPSRRLGGDFKSDRPD